MIAVATGAAGHWGKLGGSTEHHFGGIPPRGKGSGARMHQVPLAIGRGLPAQGGAVTGRHQTFCDSQERLLGWIHHGSCPRLAVAPQLSDFGSVTYSLSLSFINGDSSLSLLMAERIKCGGSCRELGKSVLKPREAPISLWRPLTASKLLSRYPSLCNYWTMTALPPMPLSYVASRA